MKDLIESIHYKGYKINIYPDEWGDNNPIQDWDMFSSFACWHRNYDLSSKDVYNGHDKRTNAEFNFYEPQDFRDFVKNNKVYYLPLYLYDHSGITIHAGDRPYPYNCQWDSSAVGWVFVTREKALKELSVKRITKKIEEKIYSMLLSEVKTFDDYITGNVYGYMIEKDGDETGGCWGFYGYDHEKSGLLEYARSEIESERKSILEKHSKKLINQIKSKVPLIYREPCELVS